VIVTEGMSVMGRCLGFVEERVEKDCRAERRFSELAVGQALEM